MKQKRRRLCRRLALALAVIMLAVTGCTSCSEDVFDGPWEGKASIEDSKAFVFKYTWDGTEEGMRIVPPAEIGGCKVVRLGGYYGRGVPCSFYVEIKDMFTRETRPPEEKQQDLIFTLVIGPEIEDVFYEDNYWYMWFYGKETTEEERIFYKVRVQVELDPANPYFYMKDGQLYKKNSDENYSDFYNPLKEKKDADGEPAGGEPTDNGSADAL